MQEFENATQLVRCLVIQLIGPEEFSRLPLDLQRKLQCAIVVRYLLQHGYAHGTDAVDPAVRLCKQTDIGAGWFLNQKMIHMLGRAVMGTEVPAFSAESQANETLIWACDRVIESIVPAAAGAIKNGV